MDEKKRLDGQNIEHERDHENRQDLGEHEVDSEQSRASAIDTGFQVSAEPEYYITPEYVSELVFCISLFLVYSLDSNDYD